MTTTTRTRTNPSLPAGRDAWATRAGVSWRDLATEVPLWLCEPVDAGEEMLTWYGDDYERDYDVARPAVHS